MAEAGPEILVATEGAVRILTFNRPERRNALSFAMYARLVELCQDADADEAVRAIVVTGAGGAFAAGTDIAEFRAFATPQHAIDYEARVDAVLSALERCRTPVIAAIDGACVGGGFAIAAVADLRIAAPSARFGLPMARTLGNMLSTASLARFAGLLGRARLAELLLSARLMEAEEARACGLVAAVEADARAAALALGARIAGFAPLTLWAAKEGLRRLAAGERADEDLVRAVYGSADFAEGVAAFLAGRRPAWQGR